MFIFELCAPLYCITHGFIVVDYNVCVRKVRYVVEVPVNVSRTNQLIYSNIFVYHFTIQIARYVIINKAILGRPI